MTDATPTTRCPHLLSPLRVGDLDLPNRVIMAPLTRSRSRQPGDVPTEMNARHYAQRASMGLLIAEATYIALVGKAYGMIPGITNDQQVAGWRLVTDAVHERGGRIFLQLFHGGRVGHLGLSGGQTPVAPSAIRASAKTYLEAGGGKVDVDEPRALEADEIPGVIGQFVDAAKRAMDAGFDGVELHGANSYILDQFTRDGSNTRTDAWGGTLEKRLRFPLAVARGVAEAIGPGRLGYRISPAGTGNSMSDSDPVATFSALGAGLGEIGIAYLHSAEWAEDAGLARRSTDAAFAAFKEAAPGNPGNGVTISNSGYTPESADAWIARGGADAVAFGTLAIANPDLVERIHAGAPLNEADPATYYGGGEAGYNDYPTMEQAT